MLNWYMFQFAVIFMRAAQEPLGVLFGKVRNYINVGRWRPFYLKQILCDCLSTS